MLSLQILSQDLVLLQKADIISSLRSDIMRMEGLRLAGETASDLGLGPIRDALPGGIFPIGAVHEFLSGDRESLASTSGFIIGLLSTLLGDNGTALWISASRTLFPPAIATFGVQPDRVVFADVKSEKDVMWVMDEALKCCALKAVVGEMKDISFSESRRLQLSVEQSRATGFLLRKNFRTLNTTACVSRWRISSLPSEIIDGLPGVGFPRWKVELLRIRNGRPGTWDLRWTNSRFVPILRQGADLEERKKAG